MDSVIYDKEFSHFPHLPSSHLIFHSDIIHLVSSIGTLIIFNSRLQTLQI